MTEKCIKTPLSGGGQHPSFFPSADTFAEGKIFFKKLGSIGERK